MPDGGRSWQMRVPVFLLRWLRSHVFVITGLIKLGLRAILLPFTVVRRVFESELSRIMIVLAAVVVLAIAIAVLPSQILRLDLGPRRAQLDAAELADATNGIRTALLQALGGLVLVSGAVATWRTLAVNREGQVTERFTRAIDQLGSETLDVRLGGIYALERIARDSTDDREPVIRVLAAYLREHARIHPEGPSEARLRNPAVGSVKPVIRVLAAYLREHARLHPDGPSEARLRNPAAGSVESVGEASEPDPEGTIRADLQIAATVIGRSRGNVGPSHDPLILSEIDLSPRLNLRRADLSYVDLSETILPFADLKWADVTGTDFSRADLRGADLEYAHYYGSSPAFGGADLRNCVLHGLDLGGADLRGADLRRATFSFHLASFGEVTADEERAAAEEQMRSAWTDESTRFPWDV